MKILHVIHDFLPRHRAGSELYVLQLARAQQGRHEVHVLCAEHDPTRGHGSLASRSYLGLPVIELVNNGAFGSFAETYRSERLNTQLGAVLAEVSPDLLHVHNLLNLSLDLPAIARGRGIPTVATLHDYTLVCPSGGQRVHLAEEFLCRVIDPERCGRCFAESAWFAQMAGRPGPTRLARRLLAALARRLPGARGVERRGPVVAPTAGDIEDRLAHVARVVESVDLFVAPSRSMADEFERLGFPPGKLRVSDYGSAPFPTRPRQPRTDRLRLGFVGTPIWHKGLHVLLEAARRLPVEGFELKVFGDPGVAPDYVRALRSRAEGLPVRFLGGFDNEGKPEVYAQIDVLVVPSLWLENSPLVIHEAFAAGVPVVASRIGGIPELVVHGRSGLLYEPFSVEELAVALRGLIAEPERVGRLAEGVPAVKGIGQDALEWEVLYQQVLERRTASTAVRAT